MKATVLQSAKDDLTAERRAALVNLLADEDPAVHRAVRAKILSYGQMACEWLHPYTLSEDPVLRHHAREIVQSLGRQSCDDRFLMFCLNSGEDLDLELGTGLLAQTHYPDVNVEGYSALYDDWAGELKGRLDLTWEPEKLLGELNQFLFEELGFKGIEQFANLPQASYLNCVVDGREGNPISLCAIYLFLSRRLCLPITGIGLPGHFLCRFQSTKAQIYLDIFRGGRFWTKADCIRHLVETCHGINEGFLSPTSPKRMLTRMCANLHQTYSQLEMHEEAQRIQRYLVALAH